MNRLLGTSAAAAADPGGLGVLTYLLASGSDRIGALDFQASSEEYVARGHRPGTLDELATSAERVEQGIPLSPDLDAALVHGSSVGALARKRC